jgi:hypothetical protein
LERDLKRGRRRLTSSLKKSPFFAPVFLKLTMPDQVGATRLGRVLGWIEG